MMNHNLNLLQPYPFEKLSKIKDAVIPPDNLQHISLSIGEPKHATPQVVLDSLQANISLISKYPLTKGGKELREAIANWLDCRYSLNGNIDSESQVLPVNGTREALFSFAQAVITTDKDALVMMPNPFYQIYEGAALLAGATPEFINLLPEAGFQPDFAGVSDEKWQKCQLLYICSPNNPTGSVLSKEVLLELLELSEKYNFIIASDECYSEIYFSNDNPPVGLLEVAAESGLDSYKNCVVFHSLSKRSNSPGLRSGFVAGDADILAKFLLYRTYHGCAMPAHHQLASIAAWQDEEHVIENRKMYQQKFKQVIKILNIEATQPEAGFYLWLKTPNSDIDFAQGLFASQNVTVLPGSFLSRTIKGYNPATGYVRLALVASIEECIEAAERINKYILEII